MLPHKSVTQIMVCNHELFFPWSLQESAKYLAASPYIRNLAMLVIAYGMSINIVEVIVVTVSLELTEYRSVKVLIKRGACILRR